MKLGESDLQAVLGRVAELARQTLPGMAGASVTLVESDRAFTAAFAGQLALDLDETQYQDGFGPCLEVAQSAGTITVPDMAAETRWPAFARQALAAGVHSSLSVALPLQEAVLGALNLYATQPANSTGTPSSWPGPSPGTPPSPSPTPASTRPLPRWPRTCGGRWKPAPSSSRPRASSSPSSTAPPSKPSNCSPGSPRPPTVSSATVPPTLSPAQLKTAPADRGVSLAGSELGQLGARRRDPHPARTEIHHQGGVNLDADDPAETVRIVGNLIPHGELLSRRSGGWGAEGTSGQEAPGRGAGWLHHFQYAAYSSPVAPGPSATATIASGISPMIMSGYRSRPRWLMALADCGAAEMLGAFDAGIG